MDGRDEGNEQRRNSGNLQHIVDRGQGPVVLSREYEVNEEDDGQSEHNSGEEDLNRERANEGWSIFEVRVLREPGAIHVKTW